MSPEKKMVMEVFEDQEILDRVEEDASPIFDEGMSCVDLLRDNYGVPREIARIRAWIVKKRVKRICRKRNLGQKEWPIEALAKLWVVLSQLNKKALSKGMLKR